MVVARFHRLLLRVRLLHHLSNFRLTRLLLSTGCLLPLRVDPVPIKRRRH